MTKLNKHAPRSVIPVEESPMNRQLWLISGFLAFGTVGCVVRARPEVVAAPDPYPYQPPPPPMEQAPEPAVDYGPAYPTVPPPAPIAEYRPPPPGYGYYWVDGYWDWTGYDWAWTNGQYVPERSGYIYVRPRYAFEGNHWVYQRSYWEGPGHRRDYNWGRPAPVNRGQPPRPV